MEQGICRKNPDKVSGAGSTAQNTTTKKSSVTKEQLSQWSREFDKKEAQRQAEPEQRTRDKALQQYTERHISDMGEWMRGTIPALPEEYRPGRNLSVRLRLRPLKRRWTWGGSGAYLRRAGTCWRTWAAGPWPTAPAGRRS